MSLDQSMEVISSPAEIVVNSDVLPASTDVNAVLNDGMNGGDGGSAAASAAQVESSSKRKRGRPRKDRSPVRLSSIRQIESSGTTISKKRGRGRPIGSGKFQKLAANCIGDFATNSSIGKFTPHAIIIQAGEDIVEKLYSFFKGSSGSICVLSGTGPISFVQIKSENSFDGVLNHQGRFQLLNISGSHSFCESALKNKMISLSVLLGNPDGRVFGGLLAGSLVAADEVNLIVGSFKHGMKCRFPKKLPFGEPVSLAKEEEEQVFVTGENGVMVQEQAADCSNTSELEGQDPMTEEDLPVNEEDAIMKEEDPIMKDEEPIMKEEEPIVKEEDAIIKEKEFNPDKMELQNDAKPTEFVTDEINENINNVDDIATEM